MNQKKKKERKYLNILFQTKNTLMLEKERDRENYTLEKHKGNENIEEIENKVKKKK